MPSFRDGSTWVAAAGIALTGLYAARLGHAVDVVATVAVGIGTIASLAVGIVRHRPALRGPWFCLLAASTLFLVGLTLRPWAVEQTGPASLLGDVFTISGYLLVIAGMTMFLRARGGLERHAVTDGVIVCLGAGLLLTEFTALPAARVGNRPDIVSILAGLYPLWDVVILLLVLNLGFSTAVRLPVFRYVAASMGMLFVGDVGYAWIGAQGHLSGSALLDLPFLLGFTAIGAGALHPSMTRMASIEPLPVQAWSLWRLSLIVAALCCSPIVVLARPELSLPDRLVLAVATGGLLAALLFRAVSAVLGLTEVQRGLRHRATHDALTGLPNRALLTEEVEGLAGGRRRGQRPVWLMFLDLDGFKLVNDHWGHDVGDLVLIEVARRIGAVIGPDRVLARISGDEFVIAGVGDTDAVTDLATTIRAEVLAPVEVAGIELVVTGSIGIAVGRGRIDAEELLRDADLAMYRAKADGRNRSRVFDSGMRAVVRERVEIELALRQALARDQLWVAFQPIVDVRTARIAGAEALLRWTHPIRGLIGPNEFIPVAEETGMIEEIGTFVLEESVRRLATWRAEGILPADFHVAVNVSTRQLRDLGLRDQLAELLARHQVGGDRLVLEITESIMMDETEQTAEILGALRNLGVGLSVDDFGTGYSSLSYLSRFPLSTVKIDRSFVCGLGVDRGDEAIVRAVVAMANALDLDVVAEGVETEGQRVALAGLGVVHGQGWLWARAEACEAFADRHLRGLMAQAGVGNS